MLHLYDRAPMARALTLDLDPRLRAVLSRRVAALDTPDGDLTEWTELLVVEPGDRDDDVGRVLGFTPLVDPDGARFGEPGFRPGWDWLSIDEGWFVLVATFGSTFAYIILVADDPRAPAELRELCSRYAYGAP